MKRILVPTDFSETAGYAFDAAMKMAKRFDSKIILFSNMLLHHDWALMNEEEKKARAEEYEYTKSIEQKLSKWEEKANKNEIEIESVTSIGSFLDNLNEVINDKKIDFVVMGSHGASGKRSFFIGSNTQKAIRAIQRPFLIVKEPIEDLHFERVVYASTFNEDDKDAFRYFLSLMASFNPEIHLVTINTFNWFNQPYVVIKSAMEDFESMCNGFVCKKHFFSDFSIEAGIRHFSKSLNADLIVVSNHQRHPIKRIFSGSNVEALVNHSNLPVLSIDY